MKVFWILLGLLPSILWAAEQPRQWLDRNLQPVDADSDKAAYYHAPAVRDGERWSLTVYYKGDNDGEAIPALKTQLDDPDLASARLVGEQIHYWEDGTVELRGTRNKDGKWHGLVREGREGKSIWETHYRAGKRHGLVRYWKNGVLVSETQYVDDHKRGDARIFYDDGSLELYEHRDVDGQLTESRRYDRDGNLTRLFIIEDSDYGPAEREERYNDDGSLKSRKIYSENRRWILKERYRGRGDKPSYRRETVDGKRHGLRVSGNPQPGGIGSYDITLYEHGLAVGDFREVDKDGNVLSRGQYERGKRVGDWVTREYGTTLYESFGNEGRRQGECRRESNDGVILEKTHYVDGKRHGEHIKRDRDGRLLRRGEYRRGKRVGRWREYDEFVEGTFEGEYVDGKRHGPWLAHSEEGREMARFRFERGDPVGKSYVFARNGSLREVTPYKDGRKHGRREVYDKGALVKVERFRNGELHGLLERFHPNGERYMAEEYDNGTYVGSIDDSDEVEKR